MKPGHVLFFAVFLLYEIVANIVDLTV